MPAISKVRMTNIQFEGGHKRINDVLYRFDGHNGALLLENGGGKTVTVQTILQTVLPHVTVAGRKIRETLVLDNTAAHVAVEWILQDRPRRYAVTAVTLYADDSGVKSEKFVDEYEGGDAHSIEQLPFVRKTKNNLERPAARQEMHDYYLERQQKRMTARTFHTLHEYNGYLEEHFGIRKKEWESIVKVNSDEGGVEAFFENCRTTDQLVSRLLIPAVEDTQPGKGTEEFVETFEKQQENFRKYRQLTRLMEESRKLETQVQEYAGQWEKLEGIRQEHLEEQRQAKTLYQFTEAELEKATLEKHLLEEQIRQREADARQVLHQKASWQLALQQQEKNRMDEAMEKARQEHTEAKLRAEELKRSDYQLKLAKLQMEIEEQEVQEQYAREKLENLDQQENLTTVREKQRRNRQKLKYRLDEEESQMKAEVSKQQQERERKKREWERRVNRLEIRQQELTELEKEKARLEEKVAGCQHRMKELESYLLALKDGQSIQQELPTWQQDLKQMETQKYALQQRLKSLEEEEKEQKETLPSLKEKVTETQQQWQQRKNQLEQMEQAEAALLEEVRQWHSRWQLYDSLYHRESTLRGDLEEQVALSENRKEESILQEQQSGVAWRQYQNREVYTADPELERMAREWRRSLDYLETGADWLASMEPEAAEKMPWWPQSLITTGDQQQEVIKRLEKARGKLSQPVMVVTEQEARQLLQQEPMEEGESAAHKTVYPPHWEHHYQPSVFQQWKEDLEKEAAEKRQLRVQAEKEASRWQERRNRLEGFFRQYSFENVAEVREQMEDWQQQYREALSELKAREESLKALEKEKASGQQHINRLLEEIPVMEQKVSKGKEYLQLNKKAEEETLNLKGKEEQRQVVEKQVDSLRQEEERLRQALHQQAIQLERWELQQRSFQQQEIYQELKDVKALKTEESRAALEEEGKQLSAVLREKHRDAEQLEAEIQACQRRLRDLDKERRLLQKESGLEEGLASFPADGWDQLQDLQSRRKEQEGFVEEKDQIHQKIQQEHAVLTAAMEKSTASIRQEYGEPIVFQEALHQVESELEKKREALEIRKKHQEEQLQQGAEVLQQLEELMTQMKIANGRYGFLRQELEVDPPSEELMRDYPYQRESWLREQLHRLQQTKMRKEQQENRLGEAAKEFQHFCIDQLNNISLRENALAVLKNRETFEEVQQWEKDLGMKIRRVRQLHEDEIREKEKLLNSFIQQLHTWMVTLMRELKRIPDKTRIKTEDGWKPVYQFTLPDMEEAALRSLIRRHVEELTEYLENSDRFRDEEGMEDAAEVRKYVESQLKSAHLLALVTKNQPLRIKCRKVTNDQRVVGIPASWETSNQWSGGEKWSKNMTLFLGILNYLAEKSQGHSGALTRRAVILDNPFGQASSDHVLAPVFFVAQQLGFQLLVLTAHGEAAMRDAFPVVYSCRLRVAEDGNKQIMNTSQELRTAYFMDQDPTALDRLGGHQQITLEEL
ncbi:Chromosome segregation ATPase [Tindallia magadiensis]|uniref:Chromosome segregation ATPase n=1 Tax=Tindallia magadiensis TaxID=69895 RepID=A0A1I3HLC0_9FIRM|nr:hypothetical protein [Tindallia magadiensis]SFI36534.1 Chromosome segregation ATPase [Tindallia magadiensis]